MNNIKINFHKQFFIIISLFIISVDSVSAAPLEICLSAEKELDQNIQIELFTECIYSEFQRVKTKENPDFQYLSVGYLGRGLSYCKIGQFSRAIDDFNDSIALNSSLAEAYKYRGILLNQLKQYEKAISDFNKVIEFKGASSELLIQRGISYGEMANVQEAVSDLEEAKTIDPNNSYIHSLLGQYYCVGKRFSESNENFKKSIKFDPNNHDTLNNYAHCLLTNKSSTIVEYQSALKLAKTAAKIIDYKDPYILDTLAAAYAMNGEFKEAVKKQQLALACVDPTEMEFVIDMESALRNYKQGKVYYQKID